MAMPVIKKRSVTVNHIHHWVGGSELAGTSGRESPVYNPATGKQTAIVELASAAEVDAAVEVASAATRQWRTTSLAKRMQVLFAFRELLDVNRHEIARLITSEHRKVVSDALGEVARGIENVEFAFGIPQMLKGE